MYPLHRCKIIHVVRHGQGFHNVAGEVDRKNYESWDFQDASLTDMGWQQAEALHQHLVTTHIRAHVELVVASPLLRALQTAAGVWGGGVLLDGEAPHSALMVHGVGQARHTPISSAGAPPVVANEWCREQNGVHPCDKRQNISFYKTKFPAVDFSEIETDEDTWWKPTTRETADDLWCRARVFMNWLLNRPERRIAVVSHSSFIFHMLHLFGEDCSDVVRKELQLGFRNCEMRSFVICDRRATSDSKSFNTDFAGGMFFKSQPMQEQRKKSGGASRQVDAEANAEIPAPDDLPTASTLDPRPSYDSRGEEIVPEKPSH